MNTNLSIPSSITIGAGSVEKLPELLKPLGHKVLLVHGHRPVEDGLLVKVRTLLAKADFPFANMGQILPNPKYGSVKRGIEVARKEGCDIIMALGGGSTLQCAKAIALGMGSKGDVWDFWTGKKKPKKIYPIASILTNPASGDELSSSCTIVRDGKQKTVSFEKLSSSLTILDPELSLYPHYPTMNQVFVIFTRLFFSWMESTGEDKIHAKELLKQLIDCASALDANILDLNARDSLYRISLEAHLHLPKPKSQLSSLAENLAFAFSMPNGSAESALFFCWINELNHGKPDVFEELIDILPQNENNAQTVNGNDPGAQVLLTSLFEKMGMPLSMRQAGLHLSKKQIKSIARNDFEKKFLKKANA